MLHKPMKFLGPLKLEKLPHGLRAILLYVEVRGDNLRLPPFAPLVPTALGLCFQGPISPVGGREVVTVTHKQKTGKSSPRQMVNRFIATPRPSARGRGPMRRTAQLSCNRLSTSPGVSKPRAPFPTVGASPRHRAPLVPVECGPADTSENVKERRKDRGTN